jgi:hypothetical protein
MEEAKNKDKFEAALNSRAEREAELRRQKAARSGRKVEPKEAWGSGASEAGGDGKSTKRGPGRGRGSAKVRPDPDAAKRAAMIEKRNRAKRTAAKMKKAAARAAVAKRLQARQNAAHAAIEEGEARTAQRKANKKLRANKAGNKVSQKQRFEEEKALRRQRKGQFEMKTKQSSKDAYAAKASRAIKRGDKAREKDTTFKYSGSGRPR